MANRLKMAEHQAIIGLSRLNWSYRRIAAELGIDRETVSRHVKAAQRESLGAPGDTVGDVPGAGPPDPNAAISIIGSVESEPGEGPGANATISIVGSPGRRSSCEAWRQIIVEGLEHGLTARRIWQDLKAEHGFEGTYQSVQRFIHKLHRAGTNGLPFRRMECAPGEEAQVDFGRGAPIITSDGQRKRPHLFRMVLSCSRKPATRSRMYWRSRSVSSAMPFNWSWVRRIAS